MAKYPKPFMKLSELTEMGLPEEWLLYVYRMRDDKKIAWKAGLKKNSPIVFDTEELERLRKASCVGR